MDKPRLSPHVTRDATIAEYQTLGQGRYRALVSTAHPVERPFGKEILSHAPGAVDLSRIARPQGIPLLRGHDARELPVGRVENPSLDPDGLRVDLVLDLGDPVARDIDGKIDRGFPPPVSIGADLDLSKVVPFPDGGGYEFQKWALKEVSFVGVDADARAGIGRSPEDATMHHADPSAAGNPAPTPSDDSLTRVLELRRVHDQVVQTMPELAERLGPALERASGNPAITPAAFREIALSMVGGGPAEPVAPPVVETERSEPFTYAGADAVDKYAQAFEECILVRSGLVQGEERAELVRNNELLGLSLVELTRYGLQLRGRKVAHLTPDALVDYAFTERAYDPPTADIKESSDFASLTASLTDKMVLRAYEEAERTWDLWCAVGSATTFNTYTRPVPSHTSDLPELVGETDDIAFLDRGDKHEQGALRTFAGIFSISRRLWVNDDAGGLADQAQSLGEAVQRLYDQTAYGVLTANAVMNEDGFTLFDDGTNRTGQANLKTGVFAPTVDNVATIRAEMRRRVDHTPGGGVPLAISPRTLIGPPELEGAFDQLRTNEWDADTPNVLKRNVRGATYRYVTSEQLTDQAAWYLQATPRLGVELTFLNGNATPRLKREEGMRKDALSWRIIADVFGMARDWRGLYKVDNA